jgi:hypothetical protein
MEHRFPDDVGRPPFGRSSLVYRNDLAVVLRDD